jgi:hypothetical protein
MQGVCGESGVRGRGKIVNVPMADGEIERMGNGMNEDII